MPNNLNPDILGELGEMRLDVGALYTHIVRMKSKLNDLQHRIDRLMVDPITLDDLDPNPGECQHGVPIGDLCTLCTREIGRAHCVIHDTDTVGPCPYCVESHRLDTPEG